MCTLTARRDQLDSTVNIGEQCSFDASLSGLVVTLVLRWRSIVMSPSLISDSTSLMVSETHFVAGLKRGECLSDGEREREKKSWRKQRKEKWSQQNASWLSLIQETKRKE